MLLKHSVKIGLANTSKKQITAKN